ncbi:MAG: hypothetical protein LUF02_00645 [Erysipelotrichaceae bacterium]|nr:hypothetical protein [Erysipelotrichaceae bacterium]
MRYKGACFIKMTFHDGSEDIGEYPYVCLLDQESGAESYHLLKGQTYRPTKHLTYVFDGSSTVITLRKPTLINLSDPYKLDFDDKRKIRLIKRLSDDIFYNLASQYYDYNTTFFLNPLYL